MAVRDEDPQPGAPRLRVIESAARLAQAAAAHVSAALRDAIDARGRALLVLAGGSTPRALHRVLAGGSNEGALPWERVEFFFGDERCVPPDSPQSNYRMARESLLDPLGARAEAVHRIEGELGALEAARRYEQVLATRPRFDLALLGLGADGHTASLFPGSPALDERELWVAPAAAPVEPRERVTLTLPAFAAARAVLFLVSGREKAAALASVLGPRAKDPLPAARIATSGALAWLVDRDAASDLANNLSK